jgi:copper chaperone NosL
MLQYVQENSISKNEIRSYYVSDFTGSHALMDATKSFLFKSEELHSPMAGNTAAFSSEDSMKTLSEHFSGQPVQFNNLLK